ncbi:hypothetical protein BGX26_011804 [Mortierella sp. AD094]|nr:hypothetical protein BGX26_011804 [Mortierella sp. AD094]
MSTVNIIPEFLGGAPGPALPLQDDRTLVGSPGHSVWVSSSPERSPTGTKSYRLDPLSRKDRYQSHTKRGSRNLRGPSSRFTWSPGSPQEKAPTPPRPGTNLFTWSPKNTGNHHQPFVSRLLDDNDASPMETNKHGIPNSSGLIANELRQEHNINRSARLVRRDLIKLGMFWGKGIRQNVLHDAPQNVAYQLQYLRKRLANLRVVNGQFVSIVPEVFLDESYCHLDHAAAKRWVTSGGVVSEPGRKPLLVIFAAFVVYYDEDTKELKRSFVEDSVHIWPAIGKAYLRKPGQRLSAHDAALWSNVPVEIQDAGIIAPPG